MRAAFVVASMLVLQLSGCSGGATQTAETTPANGAAAASTADEAPAEGDDTLERALGAARAFGEILGPALVATPEVRGFEACERAGELMNRAASLRDVGVPTEVAAPDRYREAIGRLPADATLMSTNCQGDGESLPVNFLIAVELSFYRILIPLVAARAGSQPAAGESEPIAAARDVQEILDPITAMPIDDRAGAVCEQIDGLVEGTGRLRGAGAPPELSSSAHYAEEVARLAAAANMAATYCDRGAATLTNDLVISLEITFDRVWLLLQGAWPAEPRPAP
jgi:hypothetical protein